MGWRSKPVALWAAGAAAACAIAAGAATAASPVVPVASRPTTTEAWTARVLLPVHTRSGPKESARKTGKLSVHAPYNGGPQVLLVLSASRDDGGRVWYRVRLPKRPNDASGWVPAEAVQVTRTPYRITVRLGPRRVELLRKGKVIDRWTVAVGTSANPTPVGRFAISEIVRQSRPTGFFGPYILTLTAHSANLSDFDGGDGRVALHGTSLPNLLGQAVSHGCVRLPNSGAIKLATTVPAGTPVDVLST
jgi:lipoprotein-anchoring transpeptidase ErfK/SrfK